jgi:hypothetical protein
MPQCMIKSKGLGLDILSLESVNSANDFFGISSLQMALMQRELY